MHLERRPRMASTLPSALLLASLVLTGCSGKTDVVGSGDGGSGGSSGGGSSSGGASCVDIVVSSYDISCQQATDCIEIASGQLCSGGCSCPDATINVSGQARYQSQLASIDPGFCGCPLVFPAECIDNTCTICTGGASDPPRCGTSTADAGQADAQVCVNIDLATYDRSCQTSTDCIDIASGQICSGDCACGGSAVNVDGEARYKAALSGVTIGECPCVAGGIPACIQNVCTLCGLGNQPPCPDGG
jgi:hypothetical protein